MDECYLCGKPATEKDHVPPKFLSPKSPRSDFRFVPVCSDCNRSYSHDESKFRDLITVSAAYWQPAAKDAYEATLRNFARSSERRAYQPSRDRRRILDNLVPALIKSPDGKIASKVTLIKHPQDLDSDRIAIKIGRGLHYIHTNKRIPDNFDMRGYWPKYSEDIIALIKDLPIKIRHGEFFYYAGGIGSSGESIWIMSFYKHLTLAASFIERTRV